MFDDLYERLKALGETSIENIHVRMITQHVDADYIPAGYKHLDHVGILPKGTTFEQLSDVFGDPILLNDDMDLKTGAEWFGVVNDMPFSIKNSGEEDEHIWIIDGKDSEVVGPVVDYFNANRAWMGQVENS